MEHHLEGMLDRDQRTAKLRFFERDDDGSEPATPRTYTFQEETPAAARHRCRPTRTVRSVGSGANSSHLACRNGYLLNTFQSVKNVLIIVCLTLAAIPSASSAPAMDPTYLEALYEQPMKWANPCDVQKGAQVTEASGSSDFSKSEATDIITEVTSALAQTEFNESFANQTFQKPLNEVQNDFKGQQLAYLEIEWMGPRTEDDHIAEEHLATLKIEEVLVNGDSHLQRLAVALEQVTWDQKTYSGRFVKEFENAEQHLKRVLCEMCQVMEAHELKRETVTREIMKEEDRATNMTERKSRDWMILRDYMSTLKYIQSALEHLKGSLSQR